MFKTFLIFLIALFPIYSQTTQIVLDENFDDWENAVTFNDNTGDGVGNIDFTKLSIANDDRFVYFLIGNASEINLQSNNSITFFIDTDNNVQTGYQVNGIGAELSYTFGARTGTFYHNGSESRISQSEIGLVSSPTVSSKTFELLMNRNAEIDGNKLFVSNTIKVVLTDNVTGGDALPNSGGGVEYVITDNHYVAHQYSIAKRDTSLLRIAAYNVWRDHLFDESVRENFTRILNAVSPDIISFGEIYKHTGAETAELLSQMLPGTKWYYGTNQSDVHLVSRFPILSSTPIDGNAAFVVDLTRKYNTKMLVIIAHPPCCGNDDSRQKEIDHIMAYIRDAGLEKNTPIVIAGDMNFVGKAQQVKTLLTGDIVNEDTYGKDFTPDWDGTALDDTKPLTIGYPATFTWYSEKSNYSPGRLDYLVYTGSVMKLKNSFVLFTPGMEADSLTKYDLEKEDATIASDHLPIVGDFKLDVSTKAENNNVHPATFELFQNYPNPFGEAVPSGGVITTIKYSIPTVGTAHELSVRLVVYDILGRKIATLVNERQAAGVHSVQFNAKELPSGVYFYKLQYGQYFKIRKMVLLK